MCCGPGCFWRPLQPDPVNPQQVDKQRAAKVCCCFRWSLFISFFRVVSPHVFCPGETQLDAFLIKRPDKEHLLTAGAHQTEKLAKRRKKKKKMERSIFHVCVGGGGRDRKRDMFRGS